MLVDLPWYLDAEFSDHAFLSKGVEYISPISSSALSRTSSFIGGLGKRLCPSGYSLIDYKSDRVIELLNNFYLDKCPVQSSDLEEWGILINNYPVSNQKIAKNQTAVHKLSNELLRQRFTKRDFLQERVQYRNYVSLGSNIINICLIIKALRLTSNSHSPYYLSDEFLGYYINIDFRLSENFFDDAKRILLYTKKFFEFMNYGKISLIDSCVYILESIKDKYKLAEAYFGESSNSNTFTSNMSKLEGEVRSILYSYHEIAIFIIGVLLKANIFSGFFVLGEEYSDCILQILKERKDQKYLYFNPLYIEKAKEHNINERN